MRADDTSPVLTRQLGQVVPLMAGILLLTAALGLGVARIGRSVFDRARAQNAADASALAAAVQLEPRRARLEADRVALRNGARVIRVEFVGPVVVVRVECRGVRASGAARPVPVRVRAVP